VEAFQTNVSSRAIDGGNVPRETRTKPSDAAADSRFINPRWMEAGLHQSNRPKPYHSLESAEWVLRSSIRRAIVPVELDFAKTVVCVRKLPYIN
jgi:hypothetical protein